MNTQERFANSDAHHRLLVASGVSLLVFLCLGNASLEAHIFLTWDAFSLTIILAAWHKMFVARPQNVRRTAWLQDSSRTAIFVFVIFSACASMFTLGVLLGSAKGLPKEELVEHVALSISTVVCSWWLVHTVFALRYAHTYYKKSSQKDYDGGLDFPDEKEPDYIDFAYFSFVIGMTCQVSDVQITSRAIRRLALVHGLVAFAFNAVIIAVAINTITGLGLL